MNEELIREWSENVTDSAEMDGLLKKEEIIKSRVLENKHVV